MGRRSEGRVAKNTATPLKVPAIDRARTVRRSFSGWMNFSSEIFFYFFLNAADREAHMNGAIFFG